MLAALTFLVYWPSLKSDFVYDAREEILNEGFVTSLANLPAVLSLKVLGMNLMLASRPGTLLYLMLIAAVCGKHPFGYHLCSNFLHAANAALLFILFRRLIAIESPAQVGKQPPEAQLAAATTTLIFALHPLSTETVANVSFCSDLLVTFFTLLALIAATAFRPDNFRAAAMTGTLGSFCAFAAVTSKESGMAAALLLIIYWLLFRRGEAKGPWFLFLSASTIATGAFLAARFLFAEPNLYHLPYLGGSFSQVFLIQPRLWIFMMGKLLWPAQLSADYTLENISGVSTPFALAILFVVVVMQAWLAGKSRMGSLGVAIYWLGLVSVSNFIPLNRILADRFYYLPLAGATMQLLALLLMMLRFRLGFWVAVAPFLVTLLPLTFLTLHRETVFSSDYSLWSDTLQVSPLSSSAHNGLGAALFDKGRLDEAIGQYQKALEITPNYARAENNLGIALSKSGRLDEAINEFQQTLKIDPNDPVVYFSLGYAYFQKGRLDDAVEEYLNALEINPNYLMAHVCLGEALARKGHLDDAIEEEQKALGIDPASADALNDLGSSFLQKGDMNEAIFRLQKALEIDPSYTEARNNLGIALSKKGQLNEAIVQYQKALEIAPNYVKGHYNLGIALRQKGQIDEAVVQFQQALEINPGYVDAHNELGIALSQKGHLNEAITQFQKALELDPTDVEANNNLGIAFAQKGLLDQAIAQLQRALKLKPDDHEAQMALMKVKAIAQQKAVPR